CGGGGGGGAFSGSGSGGGASGGGGGGGGGVESISICSCRLFFTYCQTLMEKLSISYRLAAAWTPAAPCSASAPSKPRIAPTRTAPAPNASTGPSGSAPVRSEDGSEET